MLTDTTVRQVQQKLNRLSMYVLGRLSAKCGKDDFGRTFRNQVLLAMSPEFDGQRVNDADSFTMLKTLGNGAWAWQ